MSDNRLLIAGGISLLAAVGVWAARRWPRAKSYDDLDGVTCYLSCGVQCRLLTSVFMAWP